MIAPIYHNNNTILYCGDCAEVLMQFPENFVDLTITSPPYDNLRKYKGFTFNFEKIAIELFRVTKNGGVVVWVVGDAVENGSETGTSFKQALFFMQCGFNLHDTMIYEKNTSTFPARKNGNRYTQIFEYMFVFSKGKPKTANLICDKKNKWGGVETWGNSWNRNSKDELVKSNHKVNIPIYSPRNNIWKYQIGRGSDRGIGGIKNHPAPFPIKLVKDHIITWSNAGDVVLDPFAGSGTTSLAAMEIGRISYGIEISDEYCNTIVKRLQDKEKEINERLF